MENRIQAVHDAAARLFLQQGYSRTQMSHIAKAVGASVGAIYLDFTGKREILHFVLKCTIDPGFPDREFERPITDELFDGLDGEIKAAFEESGREFARHLETPGDGYTFEALISDTFDLFSQYAVGCLFIEKNQFDFPDLARSYRDYRQRFFEAMTRYLSRFIEEGSVRPLAHVELSASMIIEILSWWAMDRRYLAFDAQDIPPGLAKEVCMDNIIPAYRRMER